MKKHQEHIVCVKASHFNSRQGGFVDYKLKLEHLILGQRAVLENDSDFRQVLPITIFMNDGKVWAYERTTTSGETRLHNKIALAVGGHWDIEDIVLDNGVIDLEASLEKAVNRELEEEINLDSSILTQYQLEKCICADETEVDKVHLALVTVVELDGQKLTPSENKLKSLGFISPEALLLGDYNLETWARLIAEILSSDK